MSEQTEESKFKVRCEDLLAQIERVEAEIKSAASDNKRVKHLKRDKDNLQRQFATHLGDNTVSRYYQNSKRDVVAYWRVDGVPSKKDRQEAQAWMAERGIEWSGAAPSLRSEVLKALKSDQKIPDGRFGLHVEWTVRIDAKGWLLLDTDAPYHFVPRGS
jgi:hypothetical protein